MTGFYKPAAMTKNSNRQHLAGQGPCEAPENHCGDHIVVTVDLDALEARITELEIKASFAEDTVDTLNAIVIHQQQRIDTLLEELRILREQVKSGQPEEQRSLRDDIPPHY